MAYLSPGRVTVRQFVLVFVYQNEPNGHLYLGRDFDASSRAVWVVFGLYLDDDALLQSRKSDFATI